MRIRIPPYGVVLALAVAATLLVPISWGDYAIAGFGLLLDVFGARKLALEPLYWMEKPIGENAGFMITLKGCEPMAWSSIEEMDLHISNTTRQGARLLSWGFVYLLVGLTLNEFLLA